MTLRPLIEGESYCSAYVINTTSGRSEPVKRRDFARTFLSRLSTGGLTQYLICVDSDGKGEKRSLV